MLHWLACHFFQRAFGGIGLVTVLVVFQCVPRGAVRTMFVFARMPRTVFVFAVRMRLRVRSRVSLNPSEIRVWDFVGRGVAAETAQASSVLPPHSAFVCAEVHMFQRSLICTCACRCTRVPLPGWAARRRRAPCTPLDVDHVDSTDLHGHGLGLGFVVCTLLLMFAALGGCVPCFVRL